MAHAHFVRAGHALLLLSTLAVAGGCQWISLARNALSYHTTLRGESANLALHDSLAFVTLAEYGFAIVDVRSGRTLVTQPAPEGSESVDDVAVSGHLLFVLDARPPGHLSILSLRDPLHPNLTATRDVAVGPFSGVSASGGMGIVSGGTSEMTVWRYDDGGRLEGPVASADLGRGQPDVLLSRGGDIAFVSTHYWGPHFGLDIVRYDSATRTLARLAKLEIEGAGFTSGGAKPANFPIEAAQLDDSTVLVAYARGLAVLDVSNPRAPRIDRGVLVLQR